MSSHRSMPPREKLQQLGASALSDHELIMVMLGSGNRSSSLEKVASCVQASLGRIGANPSLTDLTSVAGVGLAKGAAILGAFEFARRRAESAAFRIRKAADILPLVHDVRKKSQEHCVAISLNGNHEVVSSRIVTIGLANYCQIHPREVFADVLVDRAIAVIIVHNHPSGNLEPSREDIDVTTRLIRAGFILGITVLDHVIVTASGYLSLREQREALWSANGHTPSC